MNWVESHIVQLAYFFDLFGQILPLVLTVAVIFTFFLVQSFSRKLSRMSFYLDRIDNHLREITYFIKDQGNPDSRAEQAGESREPESSDFKDAGLNRSGEDQ